MCAGFRPGLQKILKNIFLEQFLAILRGAASHGLSHGLTRGDPDGPPQAGQETWTEQDKRTLDSTCRTRWRRLPILVAVGSAVAARRFLRS